MLIESFFVVDVFLHRFSETFIVFFLFNLCQMSSGVILPFSDFHEQYVFCVSGMKNA